VLVTGNCIDRYMLYASSKISEFAHNHEQICWTFLISQKGAGGIDSPLYDVQKIERESLSVVKKDVFGVFERKPSPSSLNLIRALGALVERGVMRDVLLKRSLRRGRDVVFECKWERDSDASLSK